jgi:glucokinase
VEEKAEMTLKKTKTYAIGVDLGATTIKAGIVNQKGAVLDQITADAKASKGPKVVTQQIIFAIQELFSKHNPAECFGIGIGSPGIVSMEDGMVRHPPNFADWTEVPLAKLVRKVFAHPVFVENDANCAAIAESRYGAGSDQKDFLFVIWGTGVGGGIILDRKVYRGPFGGAGEIGHVSIDYDGRKCNCGNCGCIEAYIGQRYLSQRTKEILEARSKGEPQSKIEQLVDGNLARIEPALISKAAEEGDETATEILEEAGELLGYALASIVNVLDVRVVVIGGGISAAPQFVFKAIEAALKSRVLKPHQAGIRVVRAKLGNAAGIIGAASLAL